MVDMEKVKKKINDVIDKLGNDITLISPGTKTYDKFGQPSYTDREEILTIGVNYNDFKSRRQTQNSGRVNNATSDLIIKGDEIVNDEYTVLIDGVEYMILEIYPIKSSNVLVAKQLRLSIK